MQAKYLYTFIICSLLLTSCIDDETPVSNLDFSAIELVVKGTYDGAPFVKNRPYSYNDGSTIQVSEFNFFVSGLSANVNADETFALDEVEFINPGLFEGDESAESGFAVAVGSAPVGEYRGFSFGVGLTPDFNETTPDEYGQNHPLANVDRFDASLNGYKFLTIAGEVDFDSDGNFDSPFNFMVGFNQNYNIISSTVTIEVLPDVTNYIELEVDLNKILDNGIRSVDFTEQLNTTNNPSDEIMLLLNSNMETAISVN